MRWLLAVFTCAALALMPSLCRAAPMTLNGVPDRPPVSPSSARIPARHLGGGISSATSAPSIRR